MTTGTLAFTQSNGNCTDFTSLAGLTVPQVASNQLSGVTASTTYAGRSVVTLGPDMRIGITAVSAVPGSSSSLAIIARCDSSANGYDFEIQSGTWFINRLDAGVPTQLATGSRTSVAGDLYEIEIIGTALKCYANGVQIGTTQSAPLYTTNNQFGIVLMRATGTLTADDMAYTDAFAPGAVIETRAVAENDGASLVWPTPTGGGAPTDYLIEKRIGPYPSLTSQAGAPSQLTTVDNTAGTAYVYRWTGAGVTIFVPGAGVRGTHNEFTGRLGTGFNAGGGTPFTDGVASPGHDTGTASVALGTTLGIAKGATVYPVRCMASDPGAGIPVSVANMRTGLAHILANAVVGHSVVFWSMLGYAAGDTDSDGHTVTSGDVTNITADVQAIIDADIPVVTAAGNNGGTYNVTPQNMTDVINVGNCNATTLDKSTTSSFGTLIDIWAVASGTGTIEASNASDSATENGGGAGYNGTSEAAPIVAGTIACMLEASGYTLTPADAKTLLLAQATATGNVGAGSPTLLVNSLTDPQAWSTISHSAFTTPEFHVTGLTTDDQVVFRVSGVNATDTGTASPPSQEITVLGIRSIAHAETRELLGRYQGNYKRLFWNGSGAGNFLPIRQKPPWIGASSTGAEGTLWDRTAAKLDIDYLWATPVSGDATATPAAVALTVTVPAPTTSGGATTAPAAVARTVTVPAPTSVTGGATTSPAAIARSVVVPAPTTTGGSNTAPAAIALAVVTPAPTASGGAGGDGTATPNAVALTAILPSATITGGATTSPAAVALVVVTPAPTVGAGATTSPAAITRTVTTPAAVATGGAATTPAAIARTVSISAPTVTGGAITSPAAIVLAAVVPAPSASGGAGGDGTASPAAIVCSVVVPAPTISGGSAATPAIVALTVVTPAVTVTGGAITSPAAIARTVVVPAPTGSGSSSATPAAITLTVVVSNPTVSGGVTVTPSTVALVVVVPAPVVTGDIIAVTPGPTLRARDPGVIYAQDPAPYRGRDARILQGVG